MSTTPETAGSTPPEDPALRRMELVVSYLLRGGVIASLIVILAGTTISFVRHPAYLSSPDELDRLVKPGDAFPRSVAEISAGIRQGRGQAIVTVGLLILIATPILRVAASVVLFTLQGDRVFAWITLGVLSLLMLSLLLGAAE